MRIYLGAYHGSQIELLALSKTGYECEPGSIHIKSPIEGDPWEFAKKIHDGVGNRVKVAVGDYFKGDDGILSVQIFVSDSWFTQR